MKLGEIKELLKAEVLWGDSALDLEIEFAGGSDLMSDVLAFGKPGILLLTGLSNAQTVRTANIIDCGECITVCPNDAILPLTDPFGELSKFKYTIAIPSPPLYAQFGREILPDKILAGLKKLGFDDAIDLAPVCGEVSFAIQEYIREYKGPKPLISIACPTIVRLIQVKYPDLIDLIIPMEPFPSKIFIIPCPKSIVGSAALPHV